MSVELLIHANPEQSAVALIDDGRLLELQIETERNRSLVGNIYRGRIRRVVPQMHAVFVDIGLPEAGLLRLNDAGKAANKTGSKIEQLFKEGQIIWVQCTKDALLSDAGLPDKGICLTTQLSLSSPSLIYFPNGHRITASKKLGNVDQRQTYIDQLQTSLAMLQKNQLEKKQKQSTLDVGGFIIRTNAQNLIEGQLLACAQKMTIDWQNVKESMRSAKHIGLVYQAPNLLERMIAELSSIVVKSLYLNQASHDTLDKVQKALITSSETSIKIESINIAESDLFKHFGLYEQIQAALLPKVDLTCGGSIVIEQTEALVSIDVNMGSAVQAGLTAKQVNLQAVQIIAEQIRLRNLSGIIIIDFISSHSPQAPQDNKELLSTLAFHFSSDSVRTDVHGMTILGLAEVSRERVRTSLSRQLVTCALFSASKT